MKNIKALPMCNKINIAKIYIKKENVAMYIKDYNVISQQLNQRNVMKMINC